MTKDADGNDNAFFTVWNGRRSLDIRSLATWTTFNVRPSTLRFDAADMHPIRGSQRILGKALKVHNVLR